MAAGKIANSAVETAKLADQAVVAGKIANNAVQTTKLADGAVTDAKVEQWQINPAVHYNAWADLQKAEMIAVIDAFQALFVHFNCDQCGVLIEVSPGRGRREYLQCMCGKVKFAFMSKPKVAA